MGVTIIVQPRPLAFTPLVIIGAPRSGTNLLRDLVTSLPGCETWPCDEINAIWRHGNVRLGHDELRREDARPRVARSIRRRFEALARSTSAEVVVEKTCANSLRVGFVDEVLPEARYLFIVRDGRDAVASALERWTAPFDGAYTARKARYVPLLDAPHYLSRMVASRLHRRRSTDGRVASWGPRMADLDAHLDRDALDVVVARQWRSCVEASLDDFAEISPERVMRIRYEELVAEPRRIVADVAAFVGVPNRLDEDLLARVTPRSIGQYGERLDADAVRRVEQVVGATMERLSHA